MLRPDDDQPLATARLGSPSRLLCSKLVKRAQLYFTCTSVCCSTLTEAVAALLNMKSCKGRLADNRPTMSGKPGHLDRNEGHGV